MHVNKYPIFALCFSILPLFAGKPELAPANVPEVLTFDELSILSETNQPPAPLAEKLDRLLRNPFLNNDASAVGAQPRRPSVNGVGPVLRVASWNIERA